MSENVREVIEQQFSELLQERSAKPAAEITDDTVLLESGLDSLGFAVLVVRLEQALGYDPFVMLKDAVYPRTFREFVSVYEENRPPA